MKPLFVLLLLLAAAAAAAAAAEPYRLEDEFWSFTYEAPGLRKLLLPGEPALLFKGRCDGGVSVVITVHEGKQVETGAAWRKRRRAELELADAVESEVPAPSLFFTRKRHGVFVEEHGYAFFARGYHCFEVHAWVADRTATSRQAILVALGGLELGKDEGSGLRARSLALREGRDPLDPKVLLAAGQAYLAENPALAAGLLARARRRLEPKQLEPEEETQLFYAGGVALLETKRYADAIPWLAEAEKRARGERAREAAYQLARATSAAGRLDEAFAALDRAFRDGLVVGKARLSKEKDLKNCRKDPRWEGFWFKRVEGK